LSTKNIKITTPIINNTSSELINSDIVLPSDTLVLETNTNKLKLGNGVDEYKDLPYLGQLVSSILPTTFHVNTATGVDDILHGLTESKPFKTIHYAIEQTVNIAKYRSINIKIYPGTYDEKISISRNHGNINLLGTTTNPVDVILANTSDPVDKYSLIISQSPYFYSIQNLTIKSSNNLSDYLASIHIANTNCEFVNCVFESRSSYNYDFTIANRSHVVIYKCAFKGNARYILFNLTHDSFLVLGNPNTIDACTIGLTLLNINSLSKVMIDGPNSLTKNGTLTGNRYSVNYGSTLFYSQYIPATTVAGTTSYGGQVL
jgi:hypothetical protein